VYKFDGDFVAHNTTDEEGASYGFSATFRSNAGVATEIGTDYTDETEDASMVTADIFVTQSGNNILFQVQGVVGKAIDWSLLSTYRKV